MVMCENAAWIGPKGTILLSDDQDDLENTVPKISFKIAAAVATLDLLAMIFSNRLDWIEPIVRVAKGFKHFWKTTCDLEYNFSGAWGSLRQSVNGAEPISWRRWCRSCFRDDFRIPRSK
jgi:hypothetical protein